MADPVVDEVTKVAETVSADVAAVKSNWKLYAIVAGVAVVAFVVFVVIVKHIF